MQAPSPYLMQVDMLHAQCCHTSWSWQSISSRPVLEQARSKHTQEHPLALDCCWVASYVHAVLTLQACRRCAAGLLSR
jgi:hypothetical protein